VDGVIWVILVSGNENSGQRDVFKLMRVAEIIVNEQVPVTCPAQEPTAHSICHLLAHSFH
jgi:hypothetical protein